MASVQNIREMVSSYVSGEVSAADFANRFTPVLMDAIKSGDDVAKQIALAVHAQISEYFNGLISEDEFLVGLSPLGKSSSQGVAEISYEVQRIEQKSVSFNQRVPAIVRNQLVTS